MNRKRMSWIAVAALALSGVAAAHDGGSHRGWNGGGYRADGGYRSAPAQHDRYQYGRYERAPSYGYGYGRAPVYSREPAYRYAPVYAARSWRRGERFEMSYGRPCGPGEYTRYGLYSPPRGYQWVQSGSDFVLAALATGVILDVLTHLH